MNYTYQIIKMFTFFKSSRKLRLMMSLSLIMCYVVMLKERDFYRNNKRFQTERLNQTLKKSKTLKD